MFSLTPGRGGNIAKQQRVSLHLNPEQGRSEQSASSREWGATSAPQVVPVLTRILVDLQVPRFSGHDFHVFLQPHPKNRNGATARKTGRGSGSYSRGTRLPSSVLPHQYLIPPSVSMITQFLSLYNAAQLTIVMQCMESVSRKRSRSAEVDLLHDYCHINPSATSDKAFHGRPLIPFKGSLHARDGSTHNSLFV